MSIERGSSRQIAQPSNPFSLTTMVKGTNIKPHIKNIPRRIQYGYD